MRYGTEVELLRNQFDAVVEDMARVIERTAFTTFVKETADFTCGLVARSGEFVAYPWSLGAASALGLNLTPTLERLTSPEPGDVYVCNDPYLGGPTCTHLPDVNVLRPVFVGGNLLCWMHALIHASDVGGVVPGSVWWKAEEVYQEGLRIRPVKLWAGDTLDESILAMILDNTRIPESNWGDLKALYAAVVTGERAVRGLVERYGLEAIESGIWNVLDYAEEEARSVFESIPKGTYDFVEYMEDDRVSDVPVRIKVRLEARGREIVLDFRGSDPQVKSSVNLVTGQVTHPFLCQALIAYLVTKNPEVPKCSSILRPVTVLSPVGSIMNAVFPAAMGTRYAMSLRVSDVVLGALAMACPGQVPAGPSGMLCPIAASVSDPWSGKRVVQVVEPLIGGSGGRPGGDGLDGVEGVFAGYLRNTPVEVVEQELDVRIRRYCLQPDTGGAGQYRGGLAVRLDIEALRPDTMVVARGLERFRLEPWGLEGGRCGTRGFCRLTRRDGVEEEVGTKGEVVLQPGDFVSFCSPAGGGYGTPEDRDPEMVALDVRNQKISTATAASQYGVVIGDNGNVCERQTSELRVDRPREMSLLPFDFGPSRADLEARWPQAIQDLCYSRSEALPPDVRNWIKHRVYQLWQQHGGPTIVHQAETFEAVWNQVEQLTPHVELRQPAALRG